ncbi:MAG TPA: hypothetical protein VJ385_10540, partial [Fibrobacteria bacterium]|nr:hypothetical protein [Fibrobacteria bacterium]
MARYRDPSPVPMVPRIQAIPSIPIPSILVGLALLGIPARALSALPGPFTLKVEIEGVTQGIFQTVEGLGSESEVVARVEDGSVREEPGAVKASRLILKRPYDPLLSGLWR